MKNNDYNLNDEPDFPLDDKENTPFGLPKDYFLSFEDKLKKRMEAENELKEFPVLVSLQKNNLFTVPTGYFTQVENSLEYKTELTDYTQLQSIHKPVFTDLAEDYKLHLQSSLNYKVELADELRSYEILYSLDKLNSYIVPEAYFESVADSIKEKVYSGEETKETILQTLLEFIFGKKIAFTFAFIFIIGLIGYFNQPDETVEQQGDCKTLACLERQEILNNKTMSNFDDDQLIDLVDINSLNKQLNLKGKEHDSTSVKNDVLDNVDVETLTDGL